MNFQSGLRFQTDLSSLRVSCKHLSVQTNLKKRKWFLNCSYNPTQSIISSHILTSKHKNGKSFDNFIFVLDFNISINHNSIVNFCDLNGLKNLVNDPTTNFDTSNSIDLILMNRPNCFQHSSVFEIGQSGLHLLTVTEIKMNFQKREPMRQLL